MCDSLYCNILFISVVQNQTLSISEVCLQHSTFQDWCFSLSIIFWRLIQVVVHINNSFLVSSISVVQFSVSKFCMCFVRFATFCEEFFKIYLFIYLFIFGCVGSLLLRTGFLQLWRAGAILCFAVRGLLIVVASLVAEHGLQVRGLQQLWCMGSVVVTQRALECRLSSCGTQAQLLCGMWDLPRPGLKPVSPALAGGLFFFFF